MRINRFLALANGVSRRQADNLIKSGQVTINNLAAKLTDHVTSNDAVSLNRKRLFLPDKTSTIMLNKPVGYVCSRRGQGSKTIYDLIPEALHDLKPIGRLDKDSSGLILLSNDGVLAQQLTHPRYAKQKIYEVVISPKLKEADRLKLIHGVKLDDGPSKLGLRPMDRTDTKWQVALSEGRNRQIRRTFAALGYTVKTLHRTSEGEYNLNKLTSGEYKTVKD